MSDGEEYQVFIGNLSWTTTDRSLEDAFSKFGKIADAKVVNDKYSGRSRGFGFVTFDKKDAMEEAIEKMNDNDLDGRAITVDRAQAGGGGGGGRRDRDRDYDRGDRRGGGGRDRGYGGGGGGGGGGGRRDRDYDRGDRRGGGGRDCGYGGGGGGGGGGDCFKCGKPGHFARECPSGDGGDRYGSDRYGGGGGGRYGSDRDGGDRYSGRSRDGGGSRSGGGRDRDRSAPYDRPR